MESKTNPAVVQSGSTENGSATESVTPEVVMTSIETEAATTAPAPTRRWLGFFAVMAALIMNLLDSTVVNVAAPSIRRDLGASYSDIQWIAAGYTLALAVG